MNSVVFIEAESQADPAALGGKGAGLAFLAESEVAIPPAFVVTADGFRHALGDATCAELEQRLAAIGSGSSEGSLEDQAATIRRLIIERTQDHPLSDELRGAYEELRARCGEDDLAVAVRSSSIAEDGGERSFAGEHDTFLWVVGAEEVERRVRDCWASLVTARAVDYGLLSGQPGEGAGLAMAVVVQQMAPARAAGVFMTLNPVNGDRSKVMIESVWGLGEPLVSGQADPDRFLLDKVTGEIVRREVASKPTEAVRDPETGRGVVTRPVEPERAAQSSLSDSEIAELVRLARMIERRAGRPQDGEFAVVPGESPENVRLLQCRPETAWSNRPRLAAGAGGDALQRVVATLTTNVPSGRS